MKSPSTERFHKSRAVMLHALAWGLRAAAPVNLDRLPEAADSHRTALRHDPSLRPNLQPVAAILSDSGDPP